MLDAARPYPAYKDSGQPWLGEVPEHWEVPRLTSRFRIRNGATPSSDEANWNGGIPWVTPADLGKLKTTTIGTTLRTISDAGLSGCAADLAPSGSIVISTRAPIGHLAITGMAACANQGCRLLTPDDAASVFWYYVLLAAKPEIVSLGRGTTFMELSRDSLAGVRLPVPPPSEQAAIVKVLSAVDRRVNRLVRAKRRLLALLGEQKQAVITHAVTRGLDPSAPTKPSGVPWLGEVPAHWEIVPLRYLGTKFGSGVTPRGGASNYVADGIPFLRSQNVQFDRLDLANAAQIRPDIHESMRNTTVRPHDVLLNITGASIGRVCWTPADFTEANVSQHVCIIRPNQSRIMPEYLASYLSSSMMQRLIREEQNGASREGLTLDAIRGFRVALPQRDEQQKIVDAIAIETTQIDAAADLARREIDLLREYRTRLVADVVTGKLDVRGVADALPDEGEDDEPVDVDGAEAEENDEGLEPVLAAGEDVENL